MRRSGKSKPVVWHWQARFMGDGVDGLLRDKTRKTGQAATGRWGGPMAGQRWPADSGHMNGRRLPGTRRNAPNGD
jgi:hypothetical protein